jgi:hypothetical protein
VYITRHNLKLEIKMTKKTVEIDLDLVTKSTAELDEDIKKDLQQEDKSIASLLEEEDED